MTQRRALIQLIGKAEGSPANADLSDPFAAIDRLGGPMLAQAKAAFKAIDIEPTECGSGFGEWDCGAFIDVDLIPKVVVALSDRFRAAFKSNLLRWHLSILDVDTEVYTKAPPA